MLSTTELERALAAAGLVAPVQFDEVTGSTNRTAWELAEAGAPEWTLVAAGHQTAGRGRLDRTWEDAPGRALLFSVVLRPTWLPADRAGMLPLAAGLAMTTATREVAGLDVRCKWPNDLLLHDRKVGGILTESRTSSTRIEHAIVGVGVNLDPPENVDLAAGLGDVDASALLVAFLRSFTSAYASNAPAFIRSIAAAYPRRCSTIGRAVEATTTDGRRVRGRAVGVDDAGSLVLQTAAGTMWITSGEVTHLR
jgi:BirA family transcriptional regulator, biotin operon repressor / biotin---[acetyl-CoA-carboxylase] ligase